MPRDCELARGGLGQADQAGLRGRVVGLAHLAGLPAHAGDLDDPSGLGPEHRPRDGLERVEGAEQVRLEHLAPRVDAHAHDQVVARDAGVVDQDVDLAERVERGLDQRLGRLRLSHVRLDGERLAAQRLDLLRGLLRGLRVARVREAHVGALLREPQRDRLPMPREPPVTTAHLPVRSITRCESRATTNLILGTSTGLVCRASRLVDASCRRMSSTCRKVRTVRGAGGRSGLPASNPLPAHSKACRRISVSARSGLQRSRMPASCATHQQGPARD